MVAGAEHRWHAALAREAADQGAGVAVTVVGDVSAHDDQVDARQVAAVVQQLLEHGSGVDAGGVRSGLAREVAVGQVQDAHGQAPGATRGAQARGEVRRGAGPLHGGDHLERQSRPGHTLPRRPRHGQLRHDGSALAWPGGLCVAAVAGPCCHGGVGTPVDMLWLRAGFEAAVVALGSVLDAEKEPVPDRLPVLGAQLVDPGRATSGPAMRAVRGVTARSRGAWEDLAGRRTAGSAAQAGSAAAARLRRCPSAARPNARQAGTSGATDRAVDALMDGLRLLFLDELHAHDPGDAMLVSPAGPGPAGPPRSPGGHLELPPARPAARPSAPRPGPAADRHDRRALRHPARRARRRPTSTGPRRRPDRLGADAQPPATAPVSLTRHGSCPCQGDAR